MFDKLQNLFKRLAVVEKTVTPEEQKGLSDETMDFDGTQDFTFDHLQSLDFTVNYPSSFSIEDIEPILEQDQRYSIRKLLGKGGMAKVWRVNDSELLRKVALKILHRDRRLDSYEQENFVIEAQITSQLQHPGIVPIYELKKLEDGATYFTMREIQGEVFREKIKDVEQVSTKTEWRGTFDGWNLRRLIEVIRDICQTLSYAHAKGVIHRDLKPSNIMIGEYGEVLLVDWGIAKLTTLGEIENLDSNLVRVEASSAFVSRRKDSIAGTPSYMAPEQIGGKYENIGPQADIYSLGVILYEILVGEKPFYGTIQEVFQAKIYQETPSIFEHFEELEEEDIEFRPAPEELAEICLKCMQKSAENRFQSTKEVMNAIQSWLDGSQKEEKARLILAEVDHKKREIEQINTKIWKIRGQLEQKIQDEMIDKEFWSRWKKLQEKQEEILLLEEDCVQSYQAALIHSPDVIDVYRGLIELEYKEYLEALTDMNYRSIKKIGKRIHLYLDMLPAKEQRYWENIRLVDRSSLYSQRIRGISIERKEPEEYLMSQMREHSWISIVGMAGIGKTHLAWLVSSRWCKQQQTELVFCDVSACDSNFLLFTTLAQALNIANLKNSPEEELIEGIKKRGEFVLLIDNAENIVEEGVLFLEKLASSVPKITIITTTRRGLGSDLEHQYRLPFMSFVEGLELFVQHAKRRRVDWDLNAEERVYLLKIIDKLDRLPLALKLAAGRVSELGLKEIEQRLSQDTSILIGRRNAEEQETLQAALELSCSMLGKREQDIFSQVSIFPASFSLEMVEFVALWEAGSILDNLEALVDDNLLLKESDEKGVRYSMLRSIREYGLSLLDENLKKTIYHRHALYFAEFYQKYQDIEEEQEFLFESMVQEFANFVQGAKFGPFDVAKDCCLACLMVIQQRGPFSLGFEIAEEFLAREDVVLNSVVEVYTLWAALHRIQGNIEQAKRIIHRISLEYLNRSDNELEEFSYPMFSLEIEDSFQASEEAAEQLMEEGQIWLSSNSAKATEKLQKAYSHYYLLQDLSKQYDILKILAEQAEHEGEYFVALGYVHRLKELVEVLETPKKQVEILNKMAVLLTRMGKEKQAIGEYNQALSIAKALQDRDNEARIYCNLGILFQARGELGEALTNYQVSKNRFEELDQKSSIGVLLSNIGTVHQIQGSFEQAKSSFEEAIALAAETNQVLHQAIFEGNLGAILMELSDFQAAEMYLRKAIEGCALQASYASGAFKSYLAVLLARKGSFMPAKILLDEAEEQLVEVKEEYGKFLCRKIEVCFLEHDLEQIEGLFEEIEQLVGELKATETSELVREFRAIQNKIPLDVWITDEKYSGMKQEGLLYAERAEIHFIQTQYSQAENYFTKSLNIFQILKDINNVLRIRGRLALIYSHKGQVKKAISIYEEIVNEYQNRGKMLSYAYAANFLGGLYRKVSQLDKALEILQKSTDILRRFKREISLVTVLDRKALTHQSRGEYQEALKAFQEAKMLADKNELVPATVFGNMGGLYMVMGDWDNAIVFTKKAVEFFRAKGDRNRETLYLGNIANVYVELQNFEEAEKIYREIIPLVRELGVKVNEGLFIGNLGDCLMRNGKYEEAEDCFIQAIDIMKERYPLAAEVFLSSYAKLTLLLGNKELAKERIEQVNESIFGKTADELIKFLVKKATIYHSVGELQAGEKLLNRVRELLFEYDFKEETGVFRAVQELEELFAQGPLPS